MKTSYNLKRRVVSAKTREDISNSLKGHPCYKNPQRGINISLANKGKFVGEKNPFYGKKHSIKSKNKMRESIKITNMTPERQEYFKIIGSGMKGKHHSKEHKEKIRNLYLGKTYEEIYGVEKAKELKLIKSSIKPSKSTIEKIRKARAKQILPVKDTKIEVKIQNYLDELGIEYFTHKYMNIEHSYQCDILIPYLNMVIECDGDYWHKYPIGNKLDHIRTKELIEKGFKVLRLWERDIQIMDIDNFKNKLKDFI